MQADDDWLKTALADAHRDFLRLVARVPLERRRQAGVCGTWSAKEVIDHLCGWDSALSAFMRDPGGFDPAPLYDVDSFNGGSVAVRRQQSWGESLAALQHGIADLQAALEGVTGEMRSQARVQSWLQGRAADYRLHAAQLEAWLR